MDKKTIQFFNWITLNTKTLDLQSYQRNKITLWLPNIIDIVAKTNNKKFGPWYGQGWGASKYIASIKAVAEILEREVMNRHRLPNSNGCAIHVDLKEAKRSAYYELIERDAFFCHYLTQTPFDKTDTKGLKVFGMNFNQLKKHLKNHKINVEVFKMRPAVKCEAVIVYVTEIGIKGRPGFQFGCSCSDVLSQAVEHALLEALRSIAHYSTNKPIKNFVENKFFHKKYDALPINTKHSNLRLNKEYHQYFKKSFFKNKSASKNIGKSFIELKDIKLKEYSTQFDDFKNLPMVFIKASSPKLIELYFGALDTKTINEKRLKLFLNKKKLPELNQRIHPFS